MATASDILAIAAKEIGYTESPKNSNKTKYGQEYGVNGVAWCVIFCWWVFHKAGADALFYGGGKIASCGSLKSYGVKNGQWVTKAYQPGDLVIFDFPGTSSTTDHIGIVESVSGSTLTTIEGNTSPDDKGSQANGGMVCRKKRSVSLAVGAYRPKYDKGAEKMNVVKGSTNNEKKMIKAIQEAVGAISDGEIGAQTMSDIARLVKADCFPITLQIYQMPVIIAPEIIPFEGKGATVAGYRNVISGSFLSGTTPWSIMVVNGNVIHREACHAIQGKPESVIYRLYDGTTGIKRAKTTDELPKGVKWAVGGLGLLKNYAPADEGFTGAYTDVLRSTNHTMLGVKGGYCYLVYCKTMTAAQVNSFAQKLGLDMAIMLDGGHVAAMYGDESFARINTTQKQYYMIQGVAK